jgi:hypothetical protein
VASKLWLSSSRSSPTHSLIGVERCDPYLEFSLSRAEREEFANFIAVMMVRVPHDRKEVGQSASKLFEQYEKLFSQRYQERMSELSSILGVQEDELESKLTNVYSLRKMLRNTPKLTALLFIMRWKFSQTDSESGFVTSDCPAVFVEPDNLNALGSVSFPLTPNLHFSAKHDKAFLRLLPKFQGSPAKGELIWTFMQESHMNVAQLSHVDKAQIKKVNRIHIQNAGRYVFSPRTTPELESFVIRRFEDR